MSDGPYRLTFTVVEDWSYCNLSVTTEVSLEMPRVPFYAYSLVGFFTYLILMGLTVGLFARRYIHKREKQELENRPSTEKSSHSEKPQITEKNQEK